MGVNLRLDQRVIVVNRIGDFGLALGVFTLFYAFRALDYDVVFSLVPLYEKETFFFIFKEISIIDLEKHLKNTE